MRRAEVADTAGFEPIDFAAELIGTFDVVVARFLARLEGLSDAELLWEPVVGCWTVREVDPGSWAMDSAGAGGVQPEPVTTIAWRMAHVAGHVLGGFATWLRDGGSPYGGDTEVPHTAAGAIELLHTSWRRWREGMVALDDDGWRRQLGDGFGAYATESTTALVLHVLDELIHHASEVALLRDLYRDRLLGAS